MNAYAPPMRATPFIESYLPCLSNQSKPNTIQSNFGPLLIFNRGIPHSIIHVLYAKRKEQESRYHRSHRPSISVLSIPAILLALLLPAPYRNSINFVFCFSLTPPRYPLTSSKP